MTHVLAQANHFCRSEGLWCGLDSEEGARAYGTGPEADPQVVAIVASKLGGIAGLKSRVCDFLSSSSDREQRWYTPLEDPAETESGSEGPPPDQEAVA